MQEWYTTDSAMVITRIEQEKGEHYIVMNNSIYFWQFVMILKMLHGVGKLVIISGNHCIFYDILVR